MTSFDELEIAVRAYTESPSKAEKKAKHRGYSPRNDHPSEWALVLDCETTADAVQTLRFGFYQLRKSGKLHFEGIFYESDALTQQEIDLIHKFADERRLTVITAREFRRDVFLEYGYACRATVIGFNLPFDLSRLAISHGNARYSMRGGFSFRYSKDRRTPSVRVKHLSRNAALLDFASPWGQSTPRGARGRGLKVTRQSGFFVDVKTLAAALMTFRGGLAALCDRLETDTRKHKTEEHGGPLTVKYLEYARADVQTTWECFEKLATEYQKHKLSKPMHRILSEASLGKGYLEEMGVRPLLAKQPEFPRELFGPLMSAYYGGRAEIRIRREIRRVLYSDFKSMYPTVNTLMGLWSYVTAKEITFCDASDETRVLLDTITLEDLRSPSFWQHLPVLVRVKPDDDLFPVRAKYDGRSNTIGLNYLTTEKPLWFTLADCIAAKLLSGKTLHILEAIRFEARDRQDGLRPISLFGNPDYHVDPANEDVFKRFVDLRDDAKSRDDAIEQAIKILANATSYGIFIEIQRDDTPDGKPEPLHIYGPDDVCLKTTSEALEQPGKYFNPLLGVMITGAARLMLALAQRLTLDAGLEWVFCDTDSLAIARPSGMGEDEFLMKAQTVIDWFVELNPYKQPGSILKIESINYEE